MIEKYLVPTIIDSGTLLLILFFGMLILAVSAIILWHLLHFILCKKYDDLLFKEPIFNPTELAIYSVWPFSLVRTMAYVLLVGAPGFFATKRRFKELTIERSNLFLLTLLCRLFLMVIALGVFLLLFMFLWGFEVYLLYG